MAGPYTDVNSIQTADEALGSIASAPLGAPSTYTATAGAAPAVEQPGQQGGFGKLNVGMQQPDWAWHPTQDDFGQVDVRRGQYDTGNVPTVNVQMPFAALANRQQANAERKAALDQRIASFDPYAGIGKAADPYQRNFGALARADMDKFVTEIADGMYGGNRTEAIKGITSDPELMAKFKSRSANWEEVGQTSQYLFKDALNMLTEAEANNMYLDPETRQAAEDLINGIGQFGSEGTGPDVMKQVELGRRFERVASREKLFKEQVVPGLDKAMRTWQDQGKIDRVSGMVRLTETEKRDFDGLVDQMSRQWAGLGLGSYEENRKYLEGRLPKSQVVDTKLQSPPSPPSGSSGDAKGQALQNAAYGVTYTGLPEAALGKKIKSTDLEGNEVWTPAEGTGSNVDFPTITLFNVSSDQATYPRAQEFRTGGTVVKENGEVVSDDKKSVRVTAHPTDIMNIGGKLFIVARKTGQPRTTTAKAGTSTGGAPSMEEPTDGGGIQNFNELEQIIIPYEGNEKMVEAAFTNLTDAGIKQALGWTGKKQNNARPRGSASTAPAKNTDPLGIL